MELQRLLLIGLCVAVLVLLLAAPFLALWLFRAYERAAQRALTAIYAEIKTAPALQPGFVRVSYHTYHGLVVWVTQTPHDVAVSPDDARLLLWRLLWFNLTWGALTYGAVFVVPLSLMNYVGERRSLARQIETELLVTRPLPNSKTEAPVKPAAPQAPPLPHRPPLLFRIAARLLLLVALGGFSGAVVQLAQGNWQEALTMVVVFVFIAGLGLSYSRTPPD